MLAHFELSLENCPEVLGLISKAWIEVSSFKMEYCQHSYINGQLWLSVGRPVT